jgi:MFS family permease
MCIVYGLNYLDKTTISYASVMGIQEDIGLVGDNYQWLGSMFYFGYIAWEYPTTRLLQRLPLAKYSSFCVIMWGVTLACFAAVTNFAGAVAIRFFLGVFEAAVTPGFALLTSQWYTKEEQGSRTGIWFSFNGFAQIFGGVVAYGIAKGTEAHPAAIEGWKIVFLLTGLLTAAIGVIFFFTVPDNQLNARWLSKEDRILAIERIRVNQQGVGNKHFKWYQLREALTDPLTWAFVFYALVADIPNGSSSPFTLLTRSLTNILPPRRYLQLLQSTHQILRLHLPAIPPVRHARRRRRSRRPDRLRFRRRLLQEPHSNRHDWSRCRHHRHVSDRRLAPRKRQWPSRRLLPHSSLAHTLRRVSIVNQQ